MFNNNDYHSLSFAERQLFDAAYQHFVDHPDLAPKSSDIPLSRKIHSLLQAALYEKGILLADQPAQPAQQPQQPQLPGNAVACRYQNLQAAGNY